MKEHMETERHRVRLIAACLLLAMVSIPLILRVVPINGIYGFRTALTMSSSEIWYPVNVFAGWALLIAAGLGATVLWILPATVKRWVLWATFWGPVLGAVVVSFMHLKRFG